MRTGAIVPHKVKLTWPAEKMEMTLTLDKVTVNPGIDAQFAAGRISAGQDVGADVPQDRLYERFRRCVS